MGFLIQNLNDRVNRFKEFISSITWSILIDLIQNIPDWLVFSNDSRIMGMIDD